MGFKIELENLSKDFSFSRALSPAGQSSAYDIINLGSIRFHNQPIDSIFTILLALNEECSGIGRGGFYHTPLRAQKEYGHPCDMVFIDEPWTTVDRETWNSMNWAERLELCEAGTNIGFSETVIPICARILLYDHAKSHARPERSLNTSDSNHAAETSVVEKIVSKPTRSGSTTVLYSPGSNVTATVTFGPANTIVTNHEASFTKPYDPAIKQGVCAYSRPIDDVSTILLRWDNGYATPFVCLSAAAEHESVCDRYPTPGDLSETFEPCTDLPRKRRYEEDEKNTPLYASVAARAAKHVLKSNVESNKDVILRLLEFSNTNNEEARKDVAMFGRIQYYWGELHARLNVDTSWRQVNLLDYWPKK